MILIQDLLSKPIKAQAVTVNMTDATDKDHLLNNLQEFVGEHYLVVEPNKHYEKYHCNIGCEDPAITLFLIVLSVPFVEGVQLQVQGIIPFVDGDFFIKQPDNQQDPESYVVNVCPPGFIRSSYDFVGESKPWVSSLAIKGEGDIIDVDFEVLNKDLGRDLVETDKSRLTLKE